jgi:hypothetical protein
MRRQAVAFFLGDAAFMADSKFLRLARRLPDDDDFNSAVGAFFRALAAARRNGKPELDAFAETGSRFISDLMAVGLLCETGFNGGPFKDWAPTAPQAIAGAARAASAERTPAGTFASAASALDPAGKLDQPSPPLPSIQLSSVDSSHVAHAREDDRPDLDAFLAVRYRIPTTAQRRFMDVYCQVFDVTGPQRAAKLIWEHPDDPIGALKEDLHAFREGRRAEAIKADEPKPRRTAGSELTGVNAEIAKYFWEQHTGEVEPSHD